TTLVVPTLASAPVVVPGGGPGGPAGVLPSQLRADPGRLALLPDFRHWSATFGVPVALLEALDWWESGWQPGVVSSTGAIGIGQLEPATVDFVRQVLLADPALDPWNPDDNIEMSARFLRYLLDGTGWQLPSAVAAYYEGLQAEQAGFVDPTTPSYVHGILAYTQVFAASGA
ncbi:MAG: transglycosylase SLT domain-containing protein, partial [Acidimicrobiales bacterium]